jgi:uncharacterized protein
VKSWRSFFQTPPPLPWVGLSLMPEKDFFQATRVLFEAGQVDVVEWSFDLGWDRGLPGWLQELLVFYSDRQRLLGHGVNYSLLSAQRQVRQSRWLDRYQAELQKYQYLHVSEHFGWLAAGKFYDGAPLSLPLTPQTLEMGIDRLQKLAQVAAIPIGLENLAFAWNVQDAIDQAAFIQQLLAPVQGFMLLDLHNLYCQMTNFNQSAVQMLDRYPLGLVREIHIAGGSWSQAGQRRIRRDTHDAAVPAAVFELLAMVLPQCPNVKAVILERLGHTLTTIEAQNGLQQDFERLRQVVAGGWR